MNGTGIKRLLEILYNPFHHFCHAANVGTKRVSGVQKRGCRFTSLTKSALDNSFIGRFETGVIIFLRRTGSTNADFRHTIFKHHYH